MLTEQHNFWKSSFADKYIKRNSFKNYQSFNNFYKKRYGYTREEINNLFLKNISKKKPILEVGCNIGNQLYALNKIGFKNLFGVDINNKSLKIAKKKYNYNFIESQAEDLPFKNNFFNLIFTNNVLIHVSPKKINKVMEEIYRCTSKYICGFEYYDNDFTEIKYRNNDNKLWKANYSKIFTSKFRNLRLVKEKIYMNLDNNKNYDKFFLLKKI